VAKARNGPVHLDHGEVGEELKLVGDADGARRLRDSLLDGADELEKAILGLGNGLE
jgi:hypothetical protein